MAAHTPASALLVRQNASPDFRSAKSYSARVARNFGNRFSRNRAWTERIFIRINDYGIFGNGPRGREAHEQTQQKNDSPRIPEARTAGPATPSCRKDRLEAVFLTS